MIRTLKITIPATLGLIVVGARAAPSDEPSQHQAPNVVLVDSTPYGISLIARKSEDPDLVWIIAPGEPFLLGEVTAVASSNATVADGPGTMPSKTESDTRSVWHQSFSYVPAGPEVRLPLHLPSLPDGAYVLTVRIRLHGDIPWASPRDVIERVARMSFDGGGGVSAVSLRAAAAEEPALAFVVDGYALNASELSSGQRDALRSAVRELADAKIVRIELGGHSCDLGTASANQKISNARALAVEELLSRELGVTSDVFASPVLFGDSDPVCKDKRGGEDCRLENRRVTIAVYFRKAPG